MLQKPGNFYNVVLWGNSSSVVESSFVTESVLNVEMIEENLSLIRQKLKKSKNNIAENLFALGHEMHNRQCTHTEERLNAKIRVINMIGSIHTCT